MESKSPYAIVEFVGENSIRCIPRAWLIGSTRAYWFPEGKFNDKHVIKNRLPATPGWPVFPVRILGSAENYEEGLKLEKRGLYRSDVEESSDSNRQRRLPKRYQSDEEEDIENTPVIRKPLPAAEEFERNSKIKRSQGRSYGRLEDAGRRVSICLQSDEGDDNERTQTIREKITRRPMPAAADFGESSTSIKNQKIRKIVQNTQIPQIQERSGSSEDADVVSPILDEESTIDRRSWQSYANERKEMPQDKFQQLVLKLLIQQRNQIKDLTAAVNRLKHPASHSAENVSVMLRQLQTADNLEELEEMLKDERYQQGYIDAVSCVGGGSMRRCVREVLQRVICKELALQYSLKGKRSKKAFNQLRLHQCILAGIRRSFPASTEAAICLEVGVTLAQARDREGGRAHRRQVCEREGGQRVEEDLSGGEDVGHLL